MNLWNLRLPLVLLAALQLVMPPVAHGQSAARLEVTVPSRLGFQGESISPLQRPVTLNAVDITLGEALSEISTQASLGLIYGSDLVPLSRRITIQFDSLPAAVALRRVLAGTNMDFNAVSEKQVVLVRRPPASADRAPQKNGVITGRVTEKGTENPVVGAQVLVDGVGRAITNPEGRYRITDVTPGKHTVSVVSIGYRGGKQEVEVGDGATVVVNFTLEAAPTQLSELVVTATGEERRRVEIGNDIVVINADSIVKNEPITSVTDLLEGRVPGLIVQRSSGAPGDPARIRLRGVSSPRGSNDPIVVVDGIRVAGPDSGERGANLAADGYAAPSPLDYIDPHMIETIQVIKGPSAATIYGQDAANGVIVITTKKGVAGKARWNVSMEHGRSRIAGDFPELYVRWGHRLINNARIHCPISGRVAGGLNAEPCVADELATGQILNDPAHTVLDEGHRTGMSIGVSGGNSGITYSVNASFGDEVGLPRLPDYAAQKFQAQHGRPVPEWMRRPQQLQQWSVQSRLQMDLGGSATASLTSNLSRTKQQRSSLEAQLGKLMATYFDPVTERYFSGAGVSLSDHLNGYENRVTAQATQFTNAVNLNWRARDWLTVTADAGVNVVWRADESLAPWGVTKGGVGGGSNPPALVVGKGTSLIGTARLAARSEVPLGLGFRMRMATGLDYTGTATDDVRATAEPQEGQPNVYALLRHFNRNTTDQATFGWYIEPGIAHRRMWLNLGLRFDGGSRYGVNVKGLKLPSFPKLSYSYLISDEPYFPDALRSVFDQLRLRVAYGHAGRQPGPGDRLRLYSVPLNQWIGAGEAEAVRLVKLGNTELKPERTREFEGGFDADIFGDRLSVSFTGFYKTTKDAILDVPIAPSVYGKVSRLENIGVVRNSGLELGIGLEPVRTDLVNWRAQLHLSRNRNVVVELGPGVQPFYTDGGGGIRSGGTRVAAGYPLFGRWTQPVLGYTDSNRDGVLDPSEIVYGDTAVYVGSQLPEYTASLHNSISLFRGALSISVSMLYEDGMTQQNAVMQELRDFSRGWNDPSASLAEQLAAVDESGYTTIQTVNILRLNSLSVNYMVPARVSRWFGANALTISLQGSNLGLWTNYTGLDPNVNSSITGNSVRDTGVIPRPRSWQIRVNASY